MFERHRLEQRMRPTEVYRRRNALTGDDYRILRVDEPGKAIAAGARFDPLRISSRSG